MSSSVLASVVSSFGRIFPPAFLWSRLKMKELVYFPRYDVVM
jgi:hypothetical protein